MNGKRKGVALLLPLYLALTAIFYRINKELTSWIAIWRFLRGLDRDGLGFYQDIDGRADSSKTAQTKKCEIKVKTPDLTRALPGSSVVGKNPLLG